jgi:hypothetical protein
VNSGIARTEISRNESRRQGNHTVESGVQTDRTIPNSKPDIIIHDNEKETCVLKQLQFQETEM